MLACCFGKSSCAQLLLSDARVILNEPGNIGFTPLRCAAHLEQLDVIKLWIASGREMDLGTTGNEKMDAIGAAKKVESWMKENIKKGKTEVVTLLERFKENPSQTRSEVRKELGITG